MKYYDKNKNYDKKKRHGVPELHALKMFTHAEPALKKNVFSHAQPA
jgi:hypothetical protein